MWFKNRTPLLHCCALVSTVKMFHWLIGKRLDIPSFSASTVLNALHQLSSYTERHWKNRPLLHNEAGACYCFGQNIGHGIKYNLESNSKNCFKCIREQLGSKIKHFKNDNLINLKPEEMIKELKKCVCTLLLSLFCSLDCNFNNKYCKNLVKLFPNFRAQKRETAQIQLLGDIDIWIFEDQLILILIQSGSNFWKQIKLRNQSPIEASLEKYFCDSLSHKTTLG